ncbi:LysR family transcriptional regulator [Rhodoblastus sphagnicola]|uniref:LysR family transcriptional regulator n=1 Tax=Rhodoblastus sphagnicola TaxID=333368 RepID=A0A2S6N9B6_9HYPH|nr:LysR family transcriptional regulator [Rhodoblastus sphagnicola]MBB4196524.1 DNA-binding transcriptional LysR family regulator [Rhodoblastus sphagnicola]PPQ31191.1 LysR family transcriptional regulator [Rhodoblastus sphagnicola]
MADRLTAMEVFVRAVRLGGLSAAAREMRMSPAMAARHLDALETRLGTTLVRRTTRRLSLTEAGADFLDKAERILMDIDEAEAEASSRSVAIEGLLRVSAPATFGVLHIAPLAARFHARHPDVTIEFGFNDRYVDLLEERWDMAIRIGRLADSSLVARKLAPMRTVVCAAPAYLARRGTPKILSDLIAHDCLGYTFTEQAGTSTWSFGRDGEIKAPVRGSLRANNGEALLRAAVAGQGLVYGPRYIAAQALAEGALVELTLDQPPLPVGAVHAILHPDRRPAAKTRAWIEFLAETLPRLAADW